MSCFLIAGRVWGDDVPQQGVGELYEQAFREFNAHHYAETLHQLDAIDACATLPREKAEALNLRAVVLMRQYEYEAAEMVLRRAIEFQPQVANAIFNLAEIPFLKRDWPEARRRFEEMLAKTDGMEAETRQLIEYKIFLTHLLQGDEEKVRRLAEELGREDRGPVAYYVRAALARAEEKPNEAEAEMAAAAERFPEALNNLYAESFYEIGWLKKPAEAGRRVFNILPPEERAALAEAEAKSNFEEAKNALQRRDVDAAWRFLDRSDELLPKQAASLNRRGEILLSQKKFNEAEATFREALAIDSTFQEAAYNLAQVAFQKGDYRGARDQLERLFSQTPGGGENQAAQLFKFEIFLTFLLGAQENEARLLMEQLPFTGATPALYYAQAAWAYAHAAPERANEWIASARRIYSPALNAIFAQPLSDLGWLENLGNEFEIPAQRVAGADSALSEISSAAAPDASFEAKPDELLSLKKSAHAETIELSQASHDDAPPLPASPNEFR